MNSHELRFAFGNPVLYAQIRRVMQKRLTYLSRATLIDLCNAIQAVERQQVKGIWLDMHGSLLLTYCDHSMN